MKIFEFDSSEDMKDGADKAARDEAEGEPLPGPAKKTKTDPTKDALRSIAACRESRAAEASTAVTTI